MNDNHTPLKNFNLVSARVGQYPNVNTVKPPLFFTAVYDITLTN